MVNWKLWAALAASVVLASCGGGDAKPEIKSLVSFGDSLSDVGTYRVGTVAAVGGGRYTVNGPAARNWTELVASEFRLPAPCPAMTGLDGSATLGFFAPVTRNSACTNHAQGGARVSLQPGPGNKLLGGANAILGQLTIPVKEQIANHLAASNGRFNGAELVTVLAGGNDLFIQAGAVPQVAASIAATGVTPSVALQQAVAQAAQAMGTAGTELATLVRNEMLAKGARYVVVVNLPDVSRTPYALAQNADGQAMVAALVGAFNQALAAGLAGTAGVVMVDAYTSSRAQAANPGAYGLTNVTTPVCSTTSAANPLGGNALTCTDASTIGVAYGTYLYADNVHPTPRGNQLLADEVLRALRVAGWL